MPHTLWNEGSFTAFFKANKQRHPWGNCCVIFWTYVPPFQHGCPRNVSEHASNPFLSQPTRVSFADQGQKGLSELSLPYVEICFYLSYLTELIWKPLQCTNTWSAFLQWVFKEKNSTEFLLLPFTCLILQEAALSFLSCLLTKEKVLSSVSCLVFLFSCCFSKQKEMWFVGCICVEVKAPGWAQESSCVHISIEV